MSEAVTVDLLIRFAYPLAYKIQGLPQWAQFAGGRRFAVDAKPTAAERGEPPPTTSQVRLMMRSLLAERFGLRLHAEATQGPVYFLVLDRGGPKHLTPAAAGDRPSRPFFMIEWTRAALYARAITLGELCTALGRQLGRPVIDKTGLVGRFSINVDPGGSDSEPPAGSPRPSSAQMVRELLRNQLGLRLRSGTGPVSTLVIDRLHAPTAN